MLVISRTGSSLEIYIIPPYTPSSLDELRHSVKNVYNAKYKNKRPLPLFFVDVHPQDDDNNDIHDITSASLLNTKVIIKKPNEKYEDHRNSITAKSMNTQKTTAVM